MEEAGSVCLYIGFWTFFFLCSPHGNIQQKPWDEFCWEVRMSFFLLLRKLSHRGPASLPPRPPSFQPLCFKEAFLFPALSSCAIRLRNISPSRWAGRPQHLGGLYWCLPSGLFRAATFSQSSAVIVIASVLIPGCSSRLSRTAKNFNISTLQPPPPTLTPSL